VIPVWVAFWVGCGCGAVFVLALICLVLVGRRGDEAIEREYRKSWPKLPRGD